MVDSTARNIILSSLQAAVSASEECWGEGCEREIGFVNEEYNSDWSWDRAVEPPMIKDSEDEPLNKG